MLRVSAQLLHALRIDTDCLLAVYTGLQQQKGDNRGDRQAKGGSGVELLRKDQKGELEAAFWNVMKFRRYSSMKKVSPEVKEKLKKTIKTMSKDFHNAAFRPETWLQNQFRNYPRECCHLSFRLHVERFYLCLCLEKYSEWAQKELARRSTSDSDDEDDEDDREKPTHSSNSPKEKNKGKLAFLVDVDFHWRTDFSFSLADEKARKRRRTN